MFFSIFFYLKNKILTLPFSILGFTHFKVINKYLFGRAKSRPEASGFLLIHYLFGSR